MNPESADDRRAFPERDEHALASLTREEVLARTAAGAVIVIPVGALEQHGPHLPSGTDAQLVEVVCRRALSTTAADVLLTPPIWTGYSPHHLRFGATVSVSATTLLVLLGDVVSSIRQWYAGPLLLVNGHGGNRGPLVTFALEHAGVITVDYWELGRTEAQDCFPTDHGSIGHAGEAETAMIAALRLGPPIPHAVDHVPAPSGDALLAPDLGEAGVIGDPSAAHAASGERFLAACARGLADLLSQLEPGPVSPDAT